MNKLNDLVKLYQEKFYTYDGYYELLQDLDFFRPDIKVISSEKGTSDSSEEISDSAANDSPDSED